MGNRREQPLIFSKNIDPRVMAIGTTILAWSLIVTSAFLFHHFFDDPQMFRKSNEGGVETLWFGIGLILIISLFQFSSTSPKSFETKWFLFHIVISLVCYFLYNQLTVEAIILPQPDMVFFAKQSSFGNPTLDEIFGNGFGIYSINLFLFSVISKECIPPENKLVKKLAAATNESNNVFLTQIKVKLANRTYFVSTADITFIKSANNYSDLHTEGGKHVIRESLRNLEEQLNPDLFIRIHRSVIIKIQEAKEFITSGNGDYKIKMKSGAIFNVGNKYKKEVLEKFEL